MIDLATGKGQRVEKTSAYTALHYCTQMAEASGNHTEMGTFDNKAYVVDDAAATAADDNANRVPNSKSKEVSRFANLDEAEIKVIKKGIRKNVIVISFAFMLLFTAFQSMANLQSSINKVASK